MIQNYIICFSECFDECSCVETSSISDFVASLCRIVEPDWEHYHHWQNLRWKVEVTKKLLLNLLKVAVVSSDILSCPSYIWSGAKQLCRFWGVGRDGLSFAADFCPDHACLLPERCWPMEKSIYINTCILYEKCVPSTFFFLDVGGLAIQALFDYFDFEWRICYDNSTFARDCWLFTLMLLLDSLS